jgi:hypothetical protein
VEVDGTSKPEEVSKTIMTAIDSVLAWDYIVRWYNNVLKWGYLERRVTAEASVDWGVIGYCLLCYCCLGFGVWGYINDWLSE